MLGYGRLCLGCGREYPSVCTLSYTVWNLYVHGTKALKSDRLHARGQPNGAAASLFQFCLFQLLLPSSFILYSHYSLSISHTLSYLVIGSAVAIWLYLHLFSLSFQGMKSLFTNERMLNVVEQLIGPDIAGHPVWNIRPKCPQNEATNVPWHQGKYSKK